MRSQLVDQVSTLRQELNWLYRRIDRTELQSKSVNPSLVESLQSQSQMKEMELARTLSALRARNPHLDADSERMGVAEIGSVQELLRESVLVEFFVAHDMIVAAVLSQSQNKMLPVAVKSTVHELQRRLWHFFHHLSLGKGTAKAKTAEPALLILQDLYAELLLPLEEFLGSAPLIIAPHDFLYLLPFHALHNGTTHLVDRGPVSYVPSADAFSQVVTTEAANPLRCGNLAYVGDATQLDVFPESLSGSHSVHLPTLSSSSSPRANGRAGTRSAIHLVAKVKLRNDNPLFSSLEVGDGSLTLLDLYRSRMLSPLVTVEGEGFAATTPSGHREVSAIWRALLTSGARSTLIPTGVYDRSIQRQHARLLYEELSQGAEMASAHRRAVLALRHEGAALHEWAGMFLVGDPFLSFKSDP
jgi:hypothetical protein